MRVATPVDSCADTLHTSHTRPRPRQNGGRVTQLRFSLFTLLPTSKTIGPSLLFRQYAGSEQQPAPGEGNPLWLGLVHAPRVLGWWLGFLTTPTSFHDDDDDDYVATDVATTRRLAHNLSHLSRKSLVCASSSSGLAIFLRGPRASLPELRCVYGRRLAAKISNTYTLSGPASCHRLRPIAFTAASWFSNQHRPTLFTSQ